MFPKGVVALIRKKMTGNIKDFIHFGRYLNVVCRPWGEVSQQRLWYVQVLCHLREGGVRVRTHLLVPTGVEAIFQVIAFLHQIFTSRVGIKCTKKQ